MDNDFSNFLHLNRRCSYHALWLIFVVQFNIMSSGILSSIQLAATAATKVGIKEEFNVSDQVFQQNRAVPEWFFESPLVPESQLEAVIWCNLNSLHYPIYHIRLASVKEYIISYIYVGFSLVVVWCRPWCFFLWAVDVWNFIVPYDAEVHPYKPQTFVIRW